jgi:hypothetical protein
LDLVAGYGIIYEEVEHLAFCSLFLVEQTVPLLLRLLDACARWS